MIDQYTGRAIPTVVLASGFPAAASGLRGLLPRRERRFPRGRIIIPTRGGRSAPRDHRRRLRRGGAAGVAKLQEVHGRTLCPCGRQCWRGRMRVRLHTHVRARPQPHVCARAIACVRACMCARAHTHTHARARTHPCASEQTHTCVRDLTHTHV